MALLQVALLAASISLSQARELADRRNGPSLAAGAVVARAAIASAGQLPNPTLSATYGPDEPRFTGTLDLRLPFLGQRGAAIHSAEANAEIAEQEFRAQRARLHAAVRRAYFAFWAASAQATLAADAAKVAQELANLTSERYRIGAAPQLDAEQATLAMRRARQDLEERAAEARATGSELDALLGTSIEGVDAPAPAAMPSLDDLLARVPIHPQLQALHANEAAALARADEERIAVRPLPTVSLTAERFSTGTEWGLRTGIAFDVPLLSLNRGKIHEQEASAQAAAIRAQIALQQLTGQLRAARARWAAASTRAAFYRGDFVESAARILEMARAGYRIGRTSLIAVLQAQSDLGAARSRAIDASLESEKAVADLEEAVGADL
ncbi:MAG: TolC family protein [Myxococcales bacterium]